MDSSVYKYSDSRYAIIGSDFVIYDKCWSVDDAEIKLRKMNNQAHLQEYSKQPYEVCLVSSAFLNVADMITAVFNFILSLVTCVLFTGLAYVIPIWLYPVTIDFLPYSYRWIGLVFVTPIPIGVAYWVHFCERDKDMSKESNRDNQRRNEMASSIILLTGAATLYQLWL